MTQAMTHPSADRTTPEADPGNESDLSTADLQHQLSDPFEELCWRCGHAPEAAGAEQKTWIRLALALRPPAPDPAVPLPEAEPARAELHLDGVDLEAPQAWLASASHRPRPTGPLLTETPSCRFAATAARSGSTSRCAGRCLEAAAPETAARRVRRCVW